MCPDHLLLVSRAHQCSSISRISSIRTRLGNFGARAENRADGTDHDGDGTGTHARKRARFWPGLVARYGGRRLRPNV
eukprot:7069480-Alexandrium_andersonii.AAC.1